MINTSETLYHAYCNSINKENHLSIASNDANKNTTSNLPVIISVNVVCVVGLPVCRGGLVCHDSEAETCNNKNVPTKSYYSMMFYVIYIEKTYQDCYFYHSYCFFNILWSTTGHADQ